MHRYVCVCMYVRVCVCMCVHACIYVCVHEHVYVSVCLCVCVSLYVHIVCIVRTRLHNVILFDESDDLLILYMMYSLHI